MNVNLNVNLDEKTLQVKTPDGVTISSIRADDVKEVAFYEGGRLTIRYNKEYAFTTGRVSQTFLMWDGFLFGEGEVRLFKKTKIWSKTKIWPVKIGKGDKDINFRNFQQEPSGRNRDFSGEEDIPIYNIPPSPKVNEEEDFINNK